MRKPKYLARLAVAAILTTSAFAGMSGPANAADDSSTADTATTSWSIPKGDGGTKGGGYTTFRWDTGWG
ncbi:hypothetical protein EFK50_09675 [Nocardioides marmoriginsengisoli]|uniref:Chitinase n=1 Tax=Nocardioides marmoriginsengisoli TaxID=661483 RepID=A0A3N0CF45_9ACTN|nr:hypothetical protein [Nocardioides marmoriginsengisoli]RNL62080.1 hypothetical protein EFK50_09675 [Nocardioides marmoriginsengisoli]